ncbi:ISAs1 family transposase [Virgibacillus natechei]
MGNGLYKGDFFNHFNGLEDKREEGKVYHRLTDILFIVTSGIICGHDEWDKIHTWATAKSTQEWLKKYISLENGIPSLSTIKRGFAVIDPQEFSTRFIEWMQASINLPLKDVVAVDGKTSNTLKNEQRIHPKMSKPNKRVKAAVDFEYRDVLIDLNFNYCYG